MEEEIHKLLFEYLDQDKATQIWNLVVEREDYQYRIIDSAVEGWKKRILELENENTQLKEKIEYLSRRQT